ncbi:MAG: preprotein translocase subunit SecA [Pseudomonadota bacterium]
MRGYAQKDNPNEYKRESFELFQAMLERVKHEASSLLSKVEIRTQEEVDREEAEQRERLMRALQARHADAQSLLAPEEGGEPVLDAEAPFVRQDAKVGRNDPCPCGSGRKFKQCHGKLQ